MSLDPKRTVAELKELRRFTADDNGAQRVAFTKTWVATRAWLKKKLEALPVEMHTDAAGNLWTALRGQSERELLIGGHMDSVLAGAAIAGIVGVLINSLLGIIDRRVFAWRYFGTVAQ